MQRTSSAKLFAQAQALLPGGVNSPVRAFRAVGGTPLFIDRAEGPYLWDVDGHRYIDCIGSWGPMILGHADADVLASLHEVIDRGTSFGAPTALETRLAEEIVDAVPSIEMLRMTSSGTEAVMGALRVARGYTGRSLVVKCIGGYHGGADYLLVKAGSGAATLGEPDSSGVPASLAATTALVHYNDVAGLEALFASRGDEVAAVIIEPVAGNMGCVPPERDWLEALRRLCTTHDACLVFDEVMTGFRLARGGAQALFGITPDLTCLGKIVGGGMPLGVYGGRRAIMEHVAPLGSVYQAGTLSGNPVAVTAGLTTLHKLRDPAFYGLLERRAAALQASIEASAARHELLCEVTRVGSMLTVFFGVQGVRSYREAEQNDQAAFARFHRALLEHGVYWPPSSFEAAFFSIRHDEAVMAALAEAMDAALAEVAGG